MGDGRRALAQAVPGRSAAGYPKRFIVFFSPNGTIADAWRPTGSELNFQLSTILAPLEPHKDKIIVVQGVDQQGGGGDGHQNGMVGMLTGQVCNPGPFKNGDGGTAGWANGISVDQRIANVIGNETKLKSLELTVQPGSRVDDWNRMSYLGPDQPVPPESSPYQAFDRLFKDLSVNSGPVDHSIDRQKTVLSLVMDEFRSLNAKLGAADRQKLEAHLTAVREIEARLGVAPQAALASCHAPVLGGPLDVAANDNFPTVGKLQMDLLVMALACDMTRVASLMWNKSVGQARFTWLGIARPHHDMSHDGDSQLDTVESLTRINHWYAEQYAYLVAALKAIPEGAGSMLDNTVLLWCNELGKGNAHSREDAPYVLAGSAGGHFKTGRYLSYPNQMPHNNLLVSLIQSMGIEDTTFGKPDWCTGPLPGLA